jgi:hypothetical protein
LSDLPPPAEKSVDQPPDQPVVKKRRWLRRLKWLAATFVVILIFGELFSRYYLGLGDPPLMMYDPDMEYRFVPSRTYHRFGHLVHYNAWSQRADDFPQHKADPSELRVMVVGDSVINGGAPTAQEDTCTAILERMLRDALHRPVIVGNISAGSWGPPNELAYLKKFGLFDADVVAFEFSDLDATDVMTFDAPLGSSGFPDRTPVSALWEGIDRYLPGVMARFRAPATPMPIAPVSDDATRAPVCMSAIREMVGMARAGGAKVFLFQHHELPERLAPEFGPKLAYGNDQIVKQAHELGLEPIEWQKEFSEAMKAGQAPYREGDYVHPSVLGNKLMAEVMFPAIRHALLEASTKPTTRP